MSIYLDNLPSWLKSLADQLIEITSEIYLVGGAIRNLMLKLPVDDYDFVVDKRSIQCARRTADMLGGKYFILDQERKTARALIPVDKTIVKLDFALFNGKNIYEDLRARDFTINAIAIPFIAGGSLIDPTGGKEDLKKKKLSPCSKSSFLDDPVRTIRYVRFLEQFGFDEGADSERLAKEAACLLGKISGERQRDALMDVINVSDVRRAFAHMLEIGIISQVFPQIDQLIEVELTPPHSFNGWDHTLQVMHYCQQIMMSIGIAPKLPIVHPRIGEALDRLRKYQTHLRSFFFQPVATGRSKYQLLVLAALFHDSAKAELPIELSGERKKYPGHARAGSRKIETWAKMKGFSKREVTYLKKSVRAHMKVSKSAMIAEETKRLSVHRFFKHAGEGGILTAVLHLADVLTTYEKALSDARWNDAILAVENLLDAYFFHFNEIISPPLILNGGEVMVQFSIPPGEQVGELLRALEEAQVNGVVKDRKQALQYLESILQD